MAIFNKAGNVYTVACMGSRERYALPVALNSTNSLKEFHTDIYLPNFFSRLSSSSFMSPALKALLNRNNPNLSCRKVRTNWLLGFSFRKRIRSEASLKSRQELLLKYGSLFSSAVSRHISANENFIGFTGQGLEAMRKTKEQGGFVVYDQVDAGLLGWQSIEKEFVEYADWVKEKFSWSVEFQKRVEEEIFISDKIIVNSDYSKSCIEKWVGKKDISVVSIPSSVPRKKREIINFNKPLRLLFLGALSVGKGVQYAIRAVDLLVKRGLDIELFLAGELHVDPGVISKFSGCAYLGTVASRDIPSLFDSVDVLIFPTLSDGFGMVQTEAISRGVPVICSDRCAAVIEHDKSGFLVSERSVDAYCAAITRYYEDRETLKFHSENAFLRSSCFSMDGYIKSINNVL